VEIFKLFGSVFIKDEEASKSLSKIDEKAENVGLTLSGLIGTAAKWGAGIAAGAGVALAGVLALTNKSAEYADMIDKLSERTGINREELQRWKYAADQSGADINKLEVGVKTLSDIMAQATNGNEKATEAFSQLGISLDDLRNKSQEDIFTEVMNALGDMEKGAARNALGNDLLGRSYVEMLPLLNAGSEGMDNLKTRADELGLVMSEEAVKANVKFGDTMADVKDSLAAVFMGIGTDLLPTMQKLLEWVIANMPQIRESISNAIDFGKTLFNGLGSAIQFVIDNSNIFLPVLAGVTAAITAQAIIGTVTNLMKAWSTATQTQTTLQWLLNAAMNANPLGLIALAIGAVIAAGVLLWKNWDTVKTKALELWDKLGWLKGVVIALSGPIGVLIAAGVSLYKNWDTVKAKMLEIWDGIKSGIKSSINFIISALNGLIRGMNRISFSVPDWVPKIGGMSWGFSLQEIPMLAKGGNILRGGSVMVGEAGPEILDLPTGAKVTPLDRANEQSQEKDPYKSITQNITINSPTPLSPSDIKRNLQQASRQLAMEWGV
jgi:hypothetical protein